MHFLTFVGLCCLATLMVSLSLGEKDEINELLENIEREEFVEELQDELEARRVIRKNLTPNLIIVYACLMVKFANLSLVQNAVELAYLTI